MATIYKSNSKLFSICAIARTAEDGTTEAHVFAAKNPKEKFDRLMMAARAAVSRKGYSDDEYRISNTWLADLLREGKLDEVRLIVLEEGFYGQNSTKVPKRGYEHDLQAMGVRLPAYEGDAQPNRLERIRNSFQEAGVKVTPPSILALKKLKSHCSEEGAWPEVTVKFQETGESHKEAMNAVKDLLLCAGYELDFSIAEDGSAILTMAAPYANERSARGNIEVSFGVLDEDGELDIPFITNADGFGLSLNASARGISRLASLLPLLKWHSELAEVAAQKEMNRRTDLLDYTPPIQEEWSLRLTDEERKSPENRNGSFRTVTKEEASTHPSDEVRHWKNVRFEDAPQLYMPHGASLGGGAGYDVCQFSDNFEIRSPGVVSGREFLAWAASVGERLTYRSKA